MQALHGRYSTAATNSQWVFQTSVNVTLLLLLCTQVVKTIFTSSIPSMLCGRLARGALWLLLFNRQQQVRGRKLADIYVCNLQGFLFDDLCVVIRAVFNFSPKKSYG
jgi:hypothetical protein